jgi:hypothetical protein
MRDFLSYLSTTSGDLSNITAPPFVLSPKSVTEMPASWAARHELFLQPAHEDDVARRALLVLKNFLCSLKYQVYNTADLDSQGVGGPRKPLNAFLGELFIGEFAAAAAAVAADGNGNSSSTRLIAEQVSHHPPVTACVLYNREHGMSSAGYVAQETTFSATTASVRVQQVGHAIVRDERHGESHLRTLPTITVKGLLTGRPYPELEGTSYIASSSGFLSTIEFGAAKKTGWLGVGGGGGGARNFVRAEVVNLREDGEKKVFEVEGQWSGRLTIRDGESGDLLEEFDVDDVPLTDVSVRPLEKQSPWESRRAWKSVIQGILKGDMNTVMSEKSKIEEAQRQMRKAEEQTGTEWSTVFFRREETSAEFELLAKAIPDDRVRDLGISRTAGVWKFIGFGAAEKLIDEGVYHRDLEPTGQIISR